MAIAAALSVGRIDLGLGDFTCGVQLEPAHARHVTATGAYLATVRGEFGFAVGLRYIGRGGAPVLGQRLLVGIVARLLRHLVVDAGFDIAVVHLLADGVGFLLRAARGQRQGQRAGQHQLDGASSHWGFHGGS
ncbi:hypothetical protein D3C79_899920 [compost metagenome]